MAAIVGEIVKLVAVCPHCGKEIPLTIKTIPVGLKVYHPHQELVDFDGWWDAKIECKIEARY